MYSLAIMITFRTDQIISKEEPPTAWFDDVVHFPSMMRHYLLHFLLCPFMLRYIHNRYFIDQFLEISTSLFSSPFFFALWLRLKSNKIARKRKSNWRLVLMIMMNRRHLAGQFKDRLGVVQWPMMGLERSTLSIHDHIHLDEKKSGLNWNAISDLWRAICVWIFSLFHFLVLVRPNKKQQKYVLDKFDRKKKKRGTQWSNYVMVECCDGSG